MNMSEVREVDIERLKWFYAKCCETDIPTLLTYKMQLCAQFNLSQKQLSDLDNYLKAIRQDMRKVFASIQNIDIIYSSYEEKKNENLNDDERETVAIYIEYIIAKYRVIIEYTMKILDMIVVYSGSKVKDNEKKLSVEEMHNMKLDYLKSLIDDNRRDILNNQWFRSIRKTRNSIIHNGATCLVFGESKEKLFQVYDLEVEELVIDDFYLYSGNCVHFDYFISLNIAYLFYFIDTIFSIILAKIGYDENIDPMMQTHLDSMLNYVGEKQECVMSWIKSILGTYAEQKLTNI